MIITLNEIEREKILVDLISGKWDNKVIGSALLLI
jgi:hypothetical protein